MKYLRAKALGSSLVAVLVAIAMTSKPAFGAAPPQPGTINYVEGNASINGRALTEKSVGSTVMRAGQTLTTQDGRAEILLTPGIFFRVDSHSAVQMISPGLADTAVALQSGRAMVDVAEIHSANNVQVRENGVSTQLLKEGLYDFDANHSQIRVFDGKAVALVGDRQVEIKGGHQLALAATGQLKAHKFDKDQYADDFYRWSSLRSSYLAEANVDAARKYYVAGGYGYGPGFWYGDGWYWDPAFGAYTFIPGAGIFYDPFGFGFYSPFFVFGAPDFDDFGHGFVHHHFTPGSRPAFSMNRNAVGRVGHAMHVGVGRSGSMTRGGSFARGPAVGGFRGGSGFHGSVGGFHGGVVRGGGGRGR